MLKQHVEDDDDMEVLVSKLWVAFEKEGAIPLPEEDGRSAHIWRRVLTPSFWSHVDYICPLHLTPIYSCMPHVPVARRVRSGRLRDVRPRHAAYPASPQAP